MEPPAKDAIVQELHRSPKGYWSGKIAGHRTILYIFQSFEGYPKSIIWEASKGRKPPITGQARTVWEAIDTIESLP